MAGSPAAIWVSASSLCGSIRPLPTRRGPPDPKGLIVISVDPSGPGQRAGIKQGDMLIRWNTDPLHSVRRVYTFLGPESVGQSITLGMLRAGKQISLTIEIAERSKPQE